MLIKPDKIITKNDLIISSVGTLSALTALQISNLNVPKISCLIGGLVFVGIFKKVKYELFNQYKRVHLFSFIRFLKDKYLNWKDCVKPYLLYLAFLEILSSITDNYLFNISNWLYVTLPLITIPLYLIGSYDQNCRAVEGYQIGLDRFYKDQCNILDYKKGLITLYSNKPFTDTDKEQLNIILNTNVTTINQDLYRKRIWTMKLKYGKENKYLKLPEKSYERLEQVLIDLKLKPTYLSTNITDTEIIHSFYTNLNPNSTKRLTANIAHKLGCNIDELIIEGKNGVDYFTIRSNDKKIYILDEIITKINIDLSKFELPFIAGVDLKTGKPLILDLIDTNHLLLIGKTGSGKSSTFKGVIETLIYLTCGKIALYLVDFRESALTRYKALKNCKYINPNIEDIAENINEIMGIMESRVKLFKENELEKLQEYNEINRGNELPYLIFCVDESNFFKNPHGLKDDDKLIKDIYLLLTQGRKYGVFIIMTCQQTNDKLFYKMWKTQFSRLIHQVRDTADVNNAGGTDKTLTNIVPKLKLGEYILDVEGEYRTVKGCLTDKKHDKLFQIIKEVYGKNEQIIEIEKSVTEVIEIESKAVNGND